MHHREQFFSKVERLLDSSRKDESVLAYLVIKLRKLKDINTTYSIETGDKLICKLEEQLNSALRPADVLSRTGDSEFGLILPAFFGQDAMIGESHLNGFDNGPFRGFVRLRDQVDFPLFSTLSRFPKYFRISSAPR